MTLVKKLGAIAIGSILLAATLVPLVSAQLNVKAAIEKLGAPGDYWIVVGKDAKVEDVISGIDLATRFAGFATKEVTLPGTTEYKVRGWDARFELDIDDLAQGKPGLAITYDKNVLPQLRDKYEIRVPYVINDNVYYTTATVEEKFVAIDRDNNNNGIQLNLDGKIYGNTTLSLKLETEGEGYFKYYVTVTSNQDFADGVDGDAGRFLRVRLGGQTFTISKIDTSSVTLFEGFGPEWVEVGKEYDIGDTGFKFVVDNVIGLGGDVTVLGKIIEKATGKTYPFTATRESGVSIPQIIDINETYSLKVVVLGGQGFAEPKTARLVIGNEKTINDGDEYNAHFKWVVDYSSESGNQLILGYLLLPKNESYAYLAPGESIVFPGSKIALTNLGLTLTDKDYLATIRIRVVNETHVEVSGVPIYTTEKVYDKIYWYYSSGAWDVDVKDATLGPTGLIADVNSTSHPNIPVVKKDNAMIINMTIDLTNKIISKIDLAGDYQLHSNFVGDKLIREYNNTWVYTKYGHKVFVSSDGKEFRLAWTPVQGYLRVALGEVTQEVVGGGKVKTLDETKLSVPVAYFDTEVDLTTVNKNLVVVGGPVVNRVAAQLLGVPYGNFEAAKTLYENLTAIEKGLIKAFELANGKFALLVAGWRAEDTRLAASVLQQYEKHLERLAAGDTLVVGGTAESPTIQAVTK